MSTGWCKDYHGPRDLKIVWDAGNGAAGEISAPDDGQAAGQSIFCCSTKSTAISPTTIPTRPYRKIWSTCRWRWPSISADLGIGFDGDGDRIGAIDGTGRIVWGDQLLAIYSKEVLANPSGPASSSPT